MALRLWLSILLCLVLLAPRCFADESPEQAAPPTANPEENLRETEHEQDELEKVKEMLRQLQQRIAEMEEQHAAEIEKLKREIEASRPTEPKTDAAEADELRMLRQAAEAEAGKPHEQIRETEETVFKAGSLSLQALNPEIRSPSTEIRRIPGNARISTSEI
jgi:septal ring factor EnvC (AmiA/AmiB activator)